MQIDLIWYIMYKTSVFIYLYAHWQHKAGRNL